MTTPPDPEQGQPNPGPYSPAPGSYGTGYGGVRYPYPGDQGPTPPGGPSPSTGYPYNPHNPYGGYGGHGADQYPAGLDHTTPPAAPRPAALVAGLVLMILAALPFLLFGALFLLLPFDASTIPPELLDNPQVAAAGVTPEALVSLLRTAGGILLALSLLYIGFAVLAFTGRSWARILVTVMTTGFSVMLLLGMASGGAADVASAVLILLPIVLSVGGLTLFFLGSSNRYFATRSG